MTKKKRKRYNSYTKGYKIDIFASLKGENHYLYVASTDCSKTCREALNRYEFSHPKFCENKKLKANFDYI